jgi:hypothetical protein
LAVILGYFDRGATNGKSQHDHSVLVGKQIEYIRELQRGSGIAAGSSCWPASGYSYWPTWCFRYTDHRQNRTFENVQHDGKVEAYEDVSTPAGTFKAFRIVTGDKSLRATS